MAIPSRVRVPILNNLTKYHEYKVISILIKQTFLDEINPRISTLEVPLPWYIYQAARYIARVLE